MFENQERDRFKLTFSPEAWHRCFLIADLLAERGEANCEYGLAGLCTRSNPSRVVLTLLLPAQRVSDVSVYQDGAGLLALRPQIRAMGARFHDSLIPRVWIHRHPTCDCTMSATDDVFLRGAFASEVAAACAVQEAPGAPPICDCAEQGRSSAVRFAVAFGLIVSRERDFKLYALRKRFCVACRASRAAYVPAVVGAAPMTAPSSRELRALRAGLEEEIGRCIRIDRDIDLLVE